MDVRRSVCRGISLPSYHVSTCLRPLLPNNRVPRFDDEKTTTTTWSPNNDNDDACRFKQAAGVLDSTLHAAKHLTSQVWLDSAVAFSGAKAYVIGRGGNKKRGITGEAVSKSDGTASG
jgi:hypothetical protein